MPSQLEEVAHAEVVWRGSSSRDRGSGCLLPESTKFHDHHVSHCANSLTYFFFSFHADHRPFGTPSFGSVTVGQVANGSFVITNTGNSPLAVSGITFPTSYTVNWTSGTIAAGESKTVLLQFAPLWAIAFNGELTVHGDQTSGANTMTVSGTGTAPPTDAPFWATSNCRTYKAGTYAPLACWVWVTTTGVAPGLRVTADLTAFGLSATQWVGKCYGCGLQVGNLDLHIPADQAAGPTPITFTVSDTAGHTYKTTGEPDGDAVGEWPRPLHEAPPPVPGLLLTSARSTRSTSARIS